MLKRNKIIFGIGIVSVVVVPTAAVISCGGSLNNDVIPVVDRPAINQAKMDKITPVMIHDAIDAKMAPAVNKMIPSVPRAWSTSLNDVFDVTIAPSNWRPADDGSVTMNVNISKIGLKSPPVFSNITIKGYKTNKQKLMDEITAAMIHGEIKRHLNPTSQKTIPVTLPVSWIANLNNLDIRIVLSNWRPVDDGSVTMDVNISKIGLKAPPIFTNITIKGYKTDEQKLMDGITMTMIHDEVRKHLDPTSQKNIPPATPASWNTNLNFLDINVILSNWRPADDGSVSMDVNISKSGLQSPPTFTNITVKGYTNFQQKMDAISKQMVHDEIKKLLDPQITKSISKVTPEPFIIMLNNIPNVTITLSKWLPTDDGSVTMTATISKIGLTSPSPFTDIKVIGYETTNQAKMNGITFAMVQQEVQQHFDPNGSIQIPNVQSDNTWIATLNLLNGVNINLSNWVANRDEGNAQMTITISKTGISNTPGPFNNVKIGGYKTANQAKMDGITAAMVNSEVQSHLTPDVNMYTPASPPVPRWTGTLNTLDNVTLTLSNWTTVEVDGYVTMTVIVSHSGLKSSKPFNNIKLMGYKQYVINLKSAVSVVSTDIPDSHDGFSIKIGNTNHYLLGTYDEGVYQVTLKPNGVVDTSIPINKTGPVSIPDVEKGFAQAIDSTHYLIGTNNNGVYQVKVDLSSGIVQSAVPVRISGTNSIPGDVASGFSSRIGNSNNYLIGTATQGVYQVSVDVNGMVTKSIPVNMSGTNSIPSVGGGFAQEIDSTHYLIGTSSSGVYQVVLDPNGMVKTTTHVLITGTNSIPDVSNGFSQKIDDTHYLIGTHSDGIYQVTVDANGMINKSVATKMIPIVRYGFIQEIDNTHYLVGTTREGVYKVTVANGIVQTAIKIHGSGTNGIPTVNGGWSQKLDNTHYWVATLRNGIFRVNLNLMK